MKWICTAATIAVLSATATVFSQKSKSNTHRLEATPQTVAYGYYWSEAKPVLRITSGDIIDVDTLLTNTPPGLERAGVKPDDVQQTLRNVVDTVTDKGPGGHILTGPVYVEGTEQGEEFEEGILSMELRIPLGVTVCLGFLLGNC